MGISAKPIQDLFARRHTRGGRGPGGEDHVTEDRLAYWKAFSDEAELHVSRLIEDRRDGDLDQVSQRPDLYRLPLDDRRG